MHLSRFTITGWSSRLAVLLTAAALCAGCSVAASDVSSLSELESGRLAAAEAMADCLEAANIPTTVYQQPVSIEPAPGENTKVHYPAVNQGGGSVDSGSVVASAPDWLVQQWDQMSVGYQEFGQAMLFVGTQDRSADFGRCLKTSGYTPPID
ncbi:MAG: hypothetical protein LBG70_03170 [Bifidobacteriaceae bacterium]|nr:hypothetical protein [Bifidobacteriaceae bacterium]